MRGLRPCMGAAIAALACSLSPAVFPAAAGELPKKLLHLSFEDETWVAFSKSRSTARVDYPSFVEGKKGKGAHITQQGEFGSIELAGNLDKARGTLSFWYKPDALQGKDKAVGEKNHVLVASGGFDKHAGNILRVWIWNSGPRFHHLRFDISRRGRGYCETKIARWEAGQWVHIAASWDNTKGITLWVNGERVSERAVTWTPVDTKELVIGGLNSKERNGGLAEGVIDELIVYDRPLTVEQIAADYRGTLNAPDAEQGPVKKMPRISRALIFHLGFEGGLDADVAKGNGAVLEARDALPAPGFKDNGVALSQEGSISYEAAGNMLKKTGTLSVWLKLNWGPKGNGFPVSKVGSRANGQDHAVLTAAASGGPAAPLFRFDLSNFLRVRWRGGQLWLPINRQVFAGVWHQYVVAWDADKRLVNVYLDGKSVHTANRFNVGSGAFTRLVLGRTADMDGLDGTLDELKIYNYPMTGAEVAKRYESDVGLVPVVLDCAAIRGRTNTVRIKLINGQTAPVSVDYRVAIRTAEGRTLTNADCIAAVAPGRSIIKALEFTPERAGIYSIRISRGGRTVKFVQGFAVGPAPLRRGRPVVAGHEPADLRLLEEIDCTENPGPAKYRDDGECRVVQSEIGAYREANTAPASGFAYRFQEIEHPERPHWLEIEYPDDKPRTFFVAVFQEKDGHVDAKGLDTIGVITGVHHPLTMKMQSKRLLFWPDSKNIMLGCYSYREYKGQAGPALARIRLYENSGPLPIRGITRPPGYPERRIGLWQEDPSMTAAVWFNQDTMHDEVDLSYWHTKWSRAIEYLNFSGQNLWNMLVFDYDGDTALDTHLVPQSWRASGSGRVPGWADLGAVMLDREGVEFFAAVNPTRRAFDKMIPAENRRSADNMRHVSARGAALVECIAANDYYTETYNPLHPVVQEQYTKMVRLYTEKFGKYRRFKGVHFLSTAKSNLYFHSLSEGYGDYNLRLFETETGVRVPVDGNAPRRYSQRHDWLMANAREEWIAWRAKKLLEFYRNLSEIVRENDKSRRLIISLRGGTVRPQEKWPLKGSSLYEYWRECGIDLKLYENETGILLVPALVPNRGRIYAEGQAGAYRDQYNWRYTSFSEELPNVLGRFEDRSAMISYHSNLEMLPHTKQKVPSYWWAFGSWGGRTNGPIHCFSTPQPSEEFVLEHLTHVLAGSDPRWIMHGWWGCPDNGDIATFARFYTAFRSIPAVNFEDVPGAADPVRVRFWRGNGESFVYLVNRESYPVQYSILLGGVTRLTNTREGTAFNPVPDGDRSRLDIALTPYEVVCLRGNGTVRIFDTDFTIPGPVVRELEQDLDRLGRAIAAEKESGADVTAVETVQDLARNALGERRYARLRHLLQSGPVLKLGARQRQRSRER
ncbi:MAG: LamG domain-containing protein [Kiritimatiellaeota bacterium]|nr:LamG domain-containing protein [Kiritimatiellota bacterium]